MSRPDAAASAALEGEVIRPGFFAFLDIVGDPIRATTVGFNLAMSGTGFPEMDGYTFMGVDGSLTDIGEVRMKEGGSERVTAKLSGLREIDNDTLNTIGNPANWRGREAILWRLIRDANGSAQGALQQYYTGYMVGLQIGGTPDGQTIEISIETFLAAFSAASNRTYLDQERYDPGDHSARAAIAIANGNSTVTTTLQTGLGTIGLRTGFNLNSKL